MTVTVVARDRRASAEADGVADVEIAATVVVGKADARAHVKCATAINLSARMKTAPVRAAASVTRWRKWRRSARI